MIAVPVSSCCRESGRKLSFEIRPTRTQKPRGSRKSCGTKEQASGGVFLVWGGFYKCVCAEGVCVWGGGVWHTIDFPRPY